MRVIMEGRKFHQILTEDINPDNSPSLSQSGIIISLTGVYKITPQFNLCMPLFPRVY
jgi:hypothetical protein